MGSIGLTDTPSNAHRRVTESGRRREPEQSIPPSRPATFPCLRHPALLIRGLCSTQTTHGPRHRARALEPEQQRVTLLCPCALHPVEVPAVGDALEFVLPGILECDSRTGRKVTHGL